MTETIEKVDVALSPELEDELTPRCQLEVQKVLDLGFVQLVLSDLTPCPNPARWMLHWTCDEGHEHTPLTCDPCHDRLEATLGEYDHYWTAL